MASGNKSENNLELSVFQLAFVTVKNNRFDELTSSWLILSIDNLCFAQLENDKMMVSN